MKGFLLSDQTRGTRSVLLKKISVFLSTMIENSFPLKSCPSFNSVHASTNQLPLLIPNACPMYVGKQSSDDVYKKCFFPRLFQ